MRTKNFIGTLVLCTSSILAAEPWTENFEAAVKQAAESDRLVLAVFSGSDWCGPCKQLKKNVFDTEEFARYAQEHFIPVELDFPRNKAQSDSIKKQNKELQTKYQITGYPTVLVLSPKGDVYGGFIGNYGSTDRVRPVLDQAIKTGRTIEAARAKAETAQGEEKVKALLEAYRALPEAIRSHHQRLIDEIMAIDENDISGLKAERKEEEEGQRQAEYCSAQLREAARQGNEALLMKIDELLQQKLKAPTKLHLLQGKAQMLLSMAKSDADIQSILDTCDEMIKIRPEDKEQIEQMKMRIRENKDRIFENNKTHQENRG